MQERIDVAADQKMSTTNGLVTPRDSQPALAQRLAFKAFEIEEPADIYFFRPLGFMVARCAAALGITPSQLTGFSMLIGIAGGALLYDPRLGLPGFALLLIHSVFDSADGQLARLTSQVSEFGRVLDGVAGYVTHAAIYIAIVAGSIHMGHTSIIGWALLAAVANIIHAQMYDYHRHHYALIVLKGTIPRDDPTQIGPSSISWLYRSYLAIQSLLNFSHTVVEARIAERSATGIVHDDDRARYQACFRWPVLGWNFLGDNVRFCAIGVLAYLQRVDLFLAFVLVPMNLVFIALWFWQRNADRKFLATG